MAIQTTRIDDLTGEPDAAEVVIVVNGEGVTIDLSPSSAEALTKLLAPYFDAGTAGRYDVERRGFARRRFAATDKPVDNATVRAWAQTHGYTVGAKGRVPQSVVDDYLRAT